MTPHEQTAYVALGLLTAIAIVECWYWFVYIPTTRRNRDADQ